MTRARFIEQIQPIIERVQESQAGIADWLGEMTPEDAAEDIADLVPQFAFTAGISIGERPHRTSDDQG